MPSTTACSPPKSLQKRPPAMAPSPRLGRPPRPRPIRSTSSGPTTRPARPIPPPNRPGNRATRHVWWDERQPGGTIRSLIFLGHPGPSLLVTGVLVAIASLAGHGLPDGIRAVQLVGAMLPVQLCIGVVNDVADLPADAVTKPHKPLVRGVIDRRSAAVLGILLGAIGLGAAATIN